ncbi:hypothetical protein OG883_28950 [Streptomyces sp. NBC_01142]|uniref:hypothetical protein n=1 Tax=Streptomyces sp. NBC_01142 TaxID=2975865 RepID=UPI0022582327|nr:hypothetical protein [Streptomyces sp. NBC_01142]MCX4823831.1 hypothetical protein [Streptomyces sp. NBC_01142]
MIRNIMGSLLALAGAAAVVFSPFRDWYDGRQGRDYRVQDLFNGITGTAAGLAASLLLPFAFAVLVTLVGLLLRSRLLVALSGVIVLGFTVLWMVRQGQAEGILTVGGSGDEGLGVGVGIAFGGGVLLLMAALVMSGRGEPAYAEPPPHEPPYEQAYGQPYEPYEPSHGQPHEPTYGSPYEPPHRPGDTAPPAAPPPDETPPQPWDPFPPHRG